MPEEQCVICQDTAGVFGNGVCRHLLCVECYVHHYRCPGVRDIDEITATRVILGLDLQLKTCPICRRFEKKAYLAEYWQTPIRVLQRELHQVLDATEGQEALRREQRCTPAVRVMRARPRGFQENVRVKILHLCEEFVTLAEYVDTASLDNIFLTLGLLVKSGAFGRVWSDRSQYRSIATYDRIGMRVASVWNRFEQAKRGLSRFGSHHLTESTLTQVNKLYEKYNLPEEARNTVVYSVLCELAWRGAFGASRAVEKFDSPKPAPRTVPYSTELVGHGISVTLPPSLSVYLNQYWFRVPEARSVRCSPVVCPFTGCRKKLQSGTAWKKHLEQHHSRDILCPWCRTTVTVRSMVHLSFRHHICDAMVARFLANIPNFASS
jgi:hypothetical protein